jgi:Kef-type K+ transport system membrane component KefB
MNVLLIVGLIILLGSIGGKIFSKFNMPQVMGYMIMGLLLGETFHGFLNHEVTESFIPIINLSLGIIGFMIGTELRIERFRRYSRSIYSILLVESLLTFFIVTVVTTLLTKKLYMGLILGALSSATAPAATYSVLGEYKARGPVTLTTLSIVALDDALALILYGFASVFARSLIVHDNVSILKTLAMPLLEIGLSVLLGVAAGIIVRFTLSRTRNRENILPLILGMIILVVGLAVYLDIDLILASMTLGIVVANFQPVQNREMFDIIKKFSPPIFILFFVLVGARMNAAILVKGGVFMLALAYTISRSIGKIAGAYIGGKLSGAYFTVTRYLGFCLMDQAGVAVGLSIAAYSTFSALGEEYRIVGITIISIITATTFLLQMISPPMIKYGIKKADEINRNVTEEDVIAEHKTSDVMNEEFFVIKENYNLAKIIDIMKRTDSYHFPVVNMAGDFMGVISLGEMRDTFNEEQMSQLILAGDMVAEADAIAYANQDLKEIMEVFETKKIGYIPVLEKEGSNKIVGELKYRRVRDYITKEVLMRQQGLEA